MKLILRYVENLEAKEIDLTGVLNIEIELNQAERYSISSDEDDGAFLDVRAIGRRTQILVRPRSGNAIRLYSDT